MCPSGGNRHSPEFPTLSEAGGLVTMTDDKANTECGHCGYQWHYSGEMSVVTCPNCTRKTAANNIEDANA